MPVSKEQLSMSDPEVKKDRIVWHLTNLDSNLHPVRSDLCALHSFIHPFSKDVMSAYSGAILGGHFFFYWSFHIQQSMSATIFSYILKLYPDSDYFSVTLYCFSGPSLIRWYKPSFTWPKWHAGLAFQPLIIHEWLRMETGLSSTLTALPLAPSPLRWEPDFRCHLLLFSWDSPHSAPVLLTLHTKHQDLWCLHLTSACKHLLGYLCGSLSCPLSLCSNVSSQQIIPWLP